MTSEALISGMFKIDKVKTNTYESINVISALYQKIEPKIINLLGKKNITFSELLTFTFKYINWTVGPRVL